MKKRILLLSAVGVGAGLFYLLSREGRGTVAEQGNGNQRDKAGRASVKTLSNSRRSNGTARLNEDDHQVDNIIIDDQGTDQSEASHILQQIRDVAFDHDNEKLALALGRPAEEIEAWTSGSGVIDGDVIMKARGLALNRGIEID